MDELLYSNSLDQGAWHLRVYGLASDRYRGILQVTDKRGRVVHQQYIRITYTRDGLDKSDIREWHITTLNVVDDPSLRRPSL